MKKSKSPPPKSSSGKPGFRIEPLHYLFLAIPVALVLWWRETPGFWLFLFSAIAIIPLAGLMGRATENLAETLGAGIGGLLNATFGNAAELIIALLALSRGTPEMVELVKASITGSIIGNILLVLGAAMLAGGLFHKKQTFNRTAAGMGATLLALACIGLLIPTVYFHMLHGRSETIVFLSEEIAIILAIVYILSLIFSLRTHQHLFAGPEEKLPTTGEHHQPEWNRQTSLTVLLVATAGVAFMSELLVSSVETAREALHMNHIFIGVIIVAVVGNAAEHSTAILVAMKNKMDLAVNIAVGSSIQIALFVAPVLVFASLLMPGPVLDLHFTQMEAIAVIIAIAVVALVAQDGETHWMEGVMLLAVYLILALAFYHLPPEVAGGH
jgi:Ca2+:H+ antiporter